MNIKDVEVGDIIRDKLKSINSYIVISKTDEEVKVIRRETMVLTKGFDNFDCYKKIGSENVVKRTLIKMLSSIWK